MAIGDNHIKAAKDVQDELDKIIGKLAKTSEALIKISANARDIGKLLAGAKTPSGAKEATEEAIKNNNILAGVLKEREALEKRLVTSQAKLITVQDQSNKSIIQNRVETNQQNRLTKEASVISSRYSTLLQKITALRNKEARIIQDLNLKKSLGNKLSKQEQTELKRSTKEFNKYDNAVKKAKTSVGRFQENVGNYPELLGSISSLTKGLIGSFGVLEGIRLAFDFASEAIQLAREAKGVEFAFNRLGFEGVKAFNDIKAATRGTLSDLEIKKSINEFNNLGISLKESGTAFEFLAVRAAQTGRSVESMREDLVTGLGRGSVRILDNLGLSMAELNKLTKEQGLSIQEAFGVIAQQEIEKAGDILDQATSNQEKFNAAFENFKLNAGSGFIGNLTNDVYGLGTAFLSVLGDINTTSTGFTSFLSNIGRYMQGQGAMIAGEAILQKELEKRPALVDEIIRIQKEQGVIELQLRLNREKLLKTNSEELAKILESLKVKKEENKTIKESVKFLREKNAELKKEQEGLTINDLVRSRAINKEIAKNKELIDTILGVSKAKEKRNKVKTNFKDLDLFEGNQTDTLDVEPKLDTTDLENSIKRVNDLAAKDLIAAFDKELLDEALDDFSASIDKFTGVNAGTIRDFIDVLDDAFKGGFENIGDLAKGTFDLLGETSNAYFESSIAEYDEQLEANNQYYEAILSNESLTEEERAKGEKDRQEREKKILAEKKKEQQKQAEINKAFAVADIILNTARGVSAALATANIPLSIAIGVLGGAQLVTALSTGIPKFAEGGVMDHDGLMMINDHHSGRLEVVERDGEYLMTNQKNAFVQGKKGDIIHKDASEVFKSVPDDKLLNNMGSYILMANMYSNINTINRLENKKAIDSYKVQTDRLIKEIRKNKPKFVINNNNSIGEELSYFKRGDF